MTVLKVCGGDLITTPLLSPASLYAGLQQMLAARPGVDAIWFDHVADPTRLKTLNDCSGRDGLFCVSLSSGLPNYRLFLPESLKACLALRSGKSLSRLRSKMRALERECGGALRVEELRSCEDWAPYADRINALMQASWQTEALGYTFDLAHHGTAADRGMIRAFLLLCGDQAVAFTLYYAGRDTLVSGYLGYDRQYARHSPGAGLFLATLEKLYEKETPRFLDFGEGDAEYKAQWANDTQQVSSLMICRDSLQLRWAFVADAACRRVTRTIRRGVNFLQPVRTLIRRAKRGDS